MPVSDALSAAYCRLTRESRQSRCTAISSGLVAVHLEPLPSFESFLFRVESPFGLHLKSGYYYTSAQMHTRYQVMHGNMETEHCLESERQRFRDLPDIML